MSDGHKAEYIERLRRVAREREALSGWVSVEERLPTVDAPVLAWCGPVEGDWLEPQAVVLKYDPISGMWQHWRNNVTHWQTLPEPPAPPLSPEEAAAQEIILKITSLCDSTVEVKNQGGTVRLTKRVHRETAEVPQWKIDALRNWLYTVRLRLLDISTDADHIYGRLVEWEPA